MRWELEEDLSWAGIGPACTENNGRGRETKEEPGVIIQMRGGRDWAQGAAGPVGGRGQVHEIFRRETGLAQCLIGWGEALM